MSALLCRRGITMAFTRGQRAAFSTNGLKVIHEPKDQEFKVNLEGHKAFLEYQKHGKMLDILHTEVPEVFRGKGVAKLLVLETFDFVAQNDLKMRIFCDYAEKVFQENKEKYQKFYEKSEPNNKL